MLLGRDPKTLLALRIPVAEVLALQLGTAHRRHRCSAELGKDLSRLHSSTAASSREHSRCAAASKNDYQAEQTDDNEVTVERLLEGVKGYLDNSQDRLFPTSRLLQNLIRRRRSQGTLFLICLLRKALSWLQRLAPAAPSPYLLENYAPIFECAPVQLEVEGCLPPALNGAYIRNGPNAVLPVAGKCNWVDGDGMLHACRIIDGAVIYSSHHIRTAKLKAELQQGDAFYLKIGDIHGLAGLLHLLLYAALILTGMVDLKKGTGTANTSLIYHAGCLQALQETDSPYKPFTAHPKIDAQTGELFYFNYDFMQKPPVSVGCLDWEGNLLREYPIDAISATNLMHDFALTENHIILYESPMKLDVQHMIHRSAGPFRWRPEQPTRLWVLDRRAQSAAGIRCFTISKAMNFMHTAAAFEVGSVLFLYATVQAEVTI
ncbi:hypothetical protein WJX84_011357 [Apatococcus fuscideae]|uniref:carotenoid 9,10-dioxygenase n=1 Tax=Apatococcus fuscideae TaxID=2026836 RepID=A0AAW1SNW9_9CHLO